MLVKTPLNIDSQILKPLHRIKAGKLIELVSPTGDSSVYLINRVTKVENIIIPFEKTMLTNMATGRIVVKGSNLMVSELSGVIETKYLQE